MSVRRFSRTPQVLTREQQEIFVQTAEDDPALLELCERVTQQDWSNLSFQQKVRALSKVQESGFALGSLAGAVRGETDLRRELDRRDYNIETEDRLVQIEQQASELRATVSELRSENAEQRDTITRLQAQLDKAPVPS